MNELKREYWAPCTRGRKVTRRNEGGEEAIALEHSKGDVVKEKGSESG